MVDNGMVSSDEGIRKTNVLQIKDRPAVKDANYVFEH